MTCKANNCDNSKNYSWDTYCSYHERCLSKLQEYSSISDIKEIETFETWFNGNCGYVINYESYYGVHDVWIVVYEPAVKSMSENLSAIKYNVSYISLSSARDKAQDLKRKLQNDSWSDTPMLEVHPRANSYETFSDLITSPYVKKESLVTGSIPLINFNLTNIENHFKPLDIIWAGRIHVSGIPFFHVGIYLGKVKEGKNWVCHLDDSDGVKITDWDSFLGVRNIGLVRYHPIIPFKHYSKIAEQIAATWYDDWRRGSYDLRNRNCEHFANMVAYGIDYSKQVYDNEGNLAASVCIPGTVAIGTMGGIGVANVASSIALAPFTGGLSLLWGAASVGLVGAGTAATVEVCERIGGETNNGKGSTIKLTEEIRKSNDKLGWKTNDWSRWIESQARQEFPTKKYCRIM